MPRKLLILALSVVALHFLVAATLKDAPAGFLCSNILQNFSAGLAAVLCFRASRRGCGLSRPFWLLMACAMLAWGVGNLGWMYYQYFFHVEPPPGSVTRFLFDSQVVFLAMASYLDPDKDSPRLSPESLLDFLQLSIVFCLIYLKLYYATAIHLEPHAAMLREFRVETAEDLVLIGLALLQFVRSRLKHVRTLYGGLVIYLFFYLLGAATSDLYQVLNEKTSGTWFDLSWTVPMLVAALWAAGWRAPEQPETPLAGGKTIGQLVTANVTYAVAPIIVLVQVAGLGPEWRFSSYMLLGASIVCYAARLGISEFRSDRSAQQLSHLVAQLSSSEARFRSLIERSSDLILLLDTAGTIRYVSPSSERVLGFEADSLEGKSLFEFVDLEDLLSLQTALSGLGPGTRRDFEARFRDSLGSVRVLEMSAANLVNETAVAGMVVNARDVTDRKRALAELKFHNVLLSTQQDSSLDGILVVDPNHKIISYNSRFVRMFGIPEETLATGSADLARKASLGELEDPERFSEQIAYLYEHPEETSHDELRFRDGRIFDRYSTPMVGADGTHYGRVWYTRDITELKRAEYALRESEERFRTVVRSAPVGIAVLGPDSVVLMCNPAFLEIVNLTEKEVLGKRLDDPTLRASREDGTPCPLDERPSVRAAAAKTPVLNVVLRHHDTAEREGKWLLASAWPLLRPDGSVYQVITSLTDITRQKKVEEELRSSRELMAQAQKSAQLGSFDWNLKTDKTVWSPELEELYGLAPGTFKGNIEDWKRRVVPEDLELAMGNLQHAMETGEALDEFRILRGNDGEMRWLVARGRVLYSDAGEPVRMIGINMDVTERKRAEEALRRSEAELRTIFENSGTGMTLVDMSGRLIRVNPAFQRLLGYSGEELEKMTFGEVTHPDDVALSAALFRELIEGKRDGYRIKKRYLGKNGEIRWAWLTVSAMRHEDTHFQYGVSTVEDITQQELAEQSLRQVSTRLLRIQEEEQRRIAREVHDSTSQEMTALTLNLGALKKSHEPLSPNAQKNIAECLVLAKRVAREIRTFSYLLHPPMLEEFGLWAALRMFIEEFRNRSRLAVSIQIDHELEGHRLEPTHEMTLFRLVQEALANVHRHAGSKTVSVAIQLQGRRIRATIADAGRGIPPLTLKEIATGTGRLVGVGILGMRERVRQIGGNLEIQSDRNGTVVAAEFPAEYSQVEASGLPDKEFSSGSGHLSS